MTQFKPRSAKTGQFVKEWINERYPDTHYIDMIRYPDKKKQA
jgi:hypothetical protein